MISADAFLRQASRTIQQTPTSPELDLRRAVSTAYYGLFHTLTAASAALIAGGAPALAAQISRSFNHRAVRKVCEEFWRCRAGQYPKPYDRLLPTSLDPRLPQLAQNFILVQEAREIADYDLTAQLTAAHLIERVQLAVSAAEAFHSIAALPETRVFLTALLVSDRWTRRG